MEVTRHPRTVWFGNVDRVVVCRWDRSGEPLILAGVASLVWKWLCGTSSDRDRLLYEAHIDLEQFLPHLDHVVDQLHLYGLVTNSEH